MFNENNLPYKYAPILKVRPAEMTALEELPDKDKDLMLPIVLLRGWVGSQKLEKSIERVEKAFDKRHWIADIDVSFLEDVQKKNTGEYPREVFHEIEELLDPTNGYNNWYMYLSNENFMHLIPTIQLGDLSQLEPQVRKLNSLNRGIVVKFNSEQINSYKYIDVLKTIKNVNNIFIIFDYGQIRRQSLELTADISSNLKKAYRIFSSGLFAISCSSFPSSFSQEETGENSIYERILYNLVKEPENNIRMIYSDRASARVEKIGGGGRIPAPRIDYPLKDDWRFKRQEFQNSSSSDDGEKEKLYTQIAKEIMQQNYWNPDLRVWGTQVIELTSRGEMLGINSPVRATAVRINIHMHQQLHYDLQESPDTDEDWVD